MEKVAVVMKMFRDSGFGIREAPEAAASERSESSRSAWGWGPTRIEKGCSRFGSSGLGSSVARLSCLVALIVLTISTSASAQVPAEGLAAEGEKRWQDALNIYQTVVGAHPERADLWIRISDIHATLGNTAASIDALYAAARATGNDPELFARLSRAYAAANQPRAALAAMQGALALRPTEPQFHRAAAELASWAGDYAEARKAYERLIQLAPNDDAAWLGLARVEVWSGSMDRSIPAYREYTKRQPDDVRGWVEWARAESWRGNDAGAMRILNHVRPRFEGTDAYRRELASVLTRGGRPGRAQDVLRPLLPQSSDDYGLNLTQALAFVQGGDGRRAREGYDTVRQLGPDRNETIGLASQLRIAFGSALQPSAAIYSDSDGLRHYRVPVSLSVALAPSFKVQGGYERDELRAPLGSGLESIDGSASTRLTRAVGGFEISPWAPLLLRAHAGRQQGPVRDVGIYDVSGTLRAGDRVRLGYSTERGLMTISPRAVSLGLERRLDRVRVALTPGFAFAIDLDGSLERITDDNQRWSFRAAPRFAVIRNQHLNLDLGASASVFSAALNLDHGYYDPERYQSYLVTAFPYFKFSENSGLSLLFEGGLQKDEQQATFEPGGSTAATLTIGIYRAWVLELSGSATMNGRLESGAFRGASGTVGITRRF